MHWSLWSTWNRCQIDAGCEEGGGSEPELSFGRGFDLCFDRSRKRKEVQGLSASVWRLTADCNIRRPDERFALSKSKVNKRRMANRNNGRLSVLHEIRELKQVGKA